MQNHSLWCSKDMQWFLQLSMLIVLQITTNKFGESAVGLWIVRQVAIRSDPRFMSYDSQIKLRVTG